MEAFKTTWHTCSLPVKASFPLDAKRAIWGLKQVPVGPDWGSGPAAGHTAAWGSTGWRGQGRTIMVHTGANTKI